MELIKKNIHMNHAKAQASAQMILDEDINVPDSNEDVGRIIAEKAHFTIEQIKGEENQALLSGSVHLDVLYTDSIGDGTLHAMNVRIPIEERLHIDGISVLDSISGRGSLDDVSLSLINSRKINIKGILNMEASVDELVDEEVLVDAKDEEGAVQTLTGGMKILQLRQHKRDNCRIRDEIVLSSAKPNIYKMLWFQAQPDNVEMKRLEGQISIHGELRLCILYASEEENHPVQVVEEVLPFHNTIECAGCSEDKIAHIRWEMNQIHMEVKPDYDGEERVFAVEAVMDLDMRLYEEEEVQILSDVYSTAQQLNPQTGTLHYHQMLVCNQSKSRVSGVLSIGKNQPRMLQLHQADAQVKAEEVTPTQEGLMVEGVICVQLLYVTSDDEMPYASLKGEIPFQQLVEVPNMEEDAEYFIQADVEQLQVLMSDSEEAECKGNLCLGVLVLGNREQMVIRDLEEQALDYAYLAKLPGMTGYIAEEGDTLWSIAKQHATTVELLCRMNDCQKGEVHRGDRFLILKQVAH